MIEIEESLVSVNWLHKNIEASNLVVLDASIPKVGNDSKVTNKRIPKARFFDMKKKFSDVSGEFPNTFPSSEQFTREAQKLGINSDSAIVIYDDKGVYSSPRAWWLFKAFGHDNVAVLDGGLPEWKRIGFPVVQKLSENDYKGNFKANLIHNRMCFFDDILYVSSDNIDKILDARSEARFKSQVPEPRKGLRSGTIPNSKNLPFASIIKDGKMKSKKELEAVFDAFGNTDEDYVFLCGSGITACVLALGATLSGRKNLTVYDGSWTEYGSLIKTNNMNWTKDELVAYVLLFAANSNFVEDNLERNEIIAKVDMQIFQKIHNEFNQDNDYQSIQKIIKGLEAHKYSKEDLDDLFVDIKMMFLSDGEYDVLEQNMMMQLKKILL